MSRLLARTARLLKVGAAVGAAVGVGRMVMRRRRGPEAGESSWPTIAETAAQDGEPADHQSGDGESGSATASDDGGSSDDDSADEESDEDKA